MSADPNRLAKAGAHMRWFLESIGIDPETVFISLGFANQTDLGVFRAAVLSNTDDKVVKQPFPGKGDVVDVHGVRVVGTVLKVKIERGPTS